MTNKRASVESRAIWLRADLIATPPARSLSGCVFRLQGHPELALESGRLTASEEHLDARIRGRGYRALRISDAHGFPLGRGRAREILRGPLYLEALRGGSVVSRTGIQIGSVLDELYPGAPMQKLGITWNGDQPTLKVWAPTANAVRLLLRVKSASDEDPAPMSATAGNTESEVSFLAARDEAGVWTVEGAPDWEDGEYRWEVKVFAPSLGSMVTNRVTDPYSVGLTVDSRRSVIVNRERAHWKPSNWNGHASAKQSNPARQAIYELHVRDFSAWDQSVPEPRRGTYLAFAEEESHGVRALRRLAQAGLTTVHLLPTFDISSEVIPEDRSSQAIPALAATGGDLASGASAEHRVVTLRPENLAGLEQVPGWSSSSELPQAAVAGVANTDAFNWGYDPWHWMTPEGSYATDGNQIGGARTLEYREMVQALHQMGLRVVQDVVFNHTYASGQERTSVLDRIVPGYYHRLCAKGEVEDSTCCANVATERAMAQKLMVDALVDAAVNYRIDGFRFDLMGHHSVENLREVRRALDALTIENDGVDGTQIYLYGEGWSFGEVANDALFTQATQHNIAGTGIGVFNDRLRDAARGGSLMDEDARARQGFTTGLLFDPNEVQELRSLNWQPRSSGSLPLPSSSDAGMVARPGDGDYQTQAHTEIQAEMFRVMDLIKVSLVGAIKDYRLRRSDGSGYVWSQDVDYFGQGAAFADEPYECVNYVEAHDDTSLYDTGVWKLALSTPMSERVDAQILANALVALGQGVSFWAAGTELLRSKSLDRDSYNSGDWFNAIDWSGEWNQFGRGVPSAARNRDRWTQMRPLLNREDLRPDTAAMRECRDKSLELLRIRAAEPLLTLGSAAEIRKRVQFVATGEASSEFCPDEPGIIAMWIDGTQVGDGHSLLVVFNAQPRPWGRVVETPQGPVFAEADARSFSVTSVL